MAAGLDPSHSEYAAMVRETATQGLERTEGRAHALAPLHRPTRRMLCISARRAGTPGRGHRHARSHCSCMPPGQHLHTALHAAQVGVLPPPQKGGAGPTCVEQKRLSRQRWQQSHDLPWKEQHQRGLGEDDPGRSA